jgi:hypothetical protein
MIGSITARIITRQNFLFPDVTEVCFIDFVKKEKPILINNVEITIISSLTS